MENVRRRAPIAYQKLLNMSRKLAGSMLRERHQDEALEAAEIDGFLKALEAMDIISERERKELYFYFRRQRPQELIREGATG